MSVLQELVASTVKVEVQGVMLNVRGLCLEEVIELTKDYFDELAKVFSGEMSFLDAIQAAPDLAAVIISLALDEPNETETAKKLPVGVQLVVLEKIWDLSIPDQAALGKLMDRIMPETQKSQEAQE